MVNFGERNMYGMFVSSLERRVGIEIWGEKFETWHSVELLGFSCCILVTSSWFYNEHMLINCSGYFTICLRCPWRNHTKDNFVNVSSCLRNSSLCNGTQQRALCTINHFIPAREVENAGGCQNAYTKEAKKNRSYIYGKAFWLLKYFCFYHFREFTTFKAQHT